MRAFIAIEFPQSVQQQLGNLAQKLRSSGLRGVRWVPPENIHLTLKFLGDIKTETVQQLTHHLPTIARVHLVYPQPPWFRCFSGITPSPCLMGWCTGTGCPFRSTTRYRVPCSALRCSSRNPPIYPSCHPGTHANRFWASGSGLARGAITGFYLNFPCFTPGQASCPFPLRSVPYRSALYLALSCRSFGKG